MEQQQSDKVLRKTDLLARIPLSDATIWRLEKAGSFPKRIQLGGNSVGWVESEINNWLEQRKAAR